MPSGSITSIYLPLRKIPQPTLAIAVGAGIVIAGLFVANQTFSQASGIFQNRHANILSRSQSAQKVSLAVPNMVASEGAPVQSVEVHIANNGLVFLRQGMITALSGGSFTVQMSWGSSQFSWMVRTNSSTQFLNGSGEQLLPQDMHVGDYVTVTGTLDRRSSQPTITAQYVRDSS
jgi:hypothetical protein